VELEGEVFLLMMDKFEMDISSISCLEDIDALEAILKSKDVSCVRLSS
jgi:hypothetical protein